MVLLTRRNSSQTWHEPAILGMSSKLGTRCPGADYAVSGEAYDDRMRTVKAGQEAMAGTGDQERIEHDVLDLVHTEVCLLHPDVKPQPRKIGANRE